MCRAVSPSLLGHRDGAARVPPLAASWAPCLGVARPDKQEGSLRGPFGAKRQIVTAHRSRRSGWEIIGQPHGMHAGCHTKRQRGRGHSHLRSLGAAVPRWMLRKSGLAGTRPLHRQGMAAERRFGCWIVGRHPCSTSRIMDPSTAWKAHTAAKALDMHCSSRLHPRKRT